MTGRERILNTLEFKGTDRIPMDVWVLPAARMEHGERLAALQEKYAGRMDITSIVGPFDHGFTPAYYEPGEFTDPWGSVWRNLQPGVIGEVKALVFADYAAMEGYIPPLSNSKRNGRSTGRKPPPGSPRPGRRGNSSSAAGSASLSGCSSCGGLRNCTATSPWRRKSWTG